MNDLTLAVAAVTIGTAGATLVVALAETTPLGRLFERIGAHLAGDHLPRVGCEAPSNVRKIPNTNQGETRD